MPVTFGSLFAGIGGMDLGLERAGMTCKWQVEIDPYATRVLAKHWPDVRRWSDIRTLFTTTPQSTADWRVDLICGGFPCQDISAAGKRVGIDGEQSGLWGEFQRLICVLRPRFVLMENSADLVHRGITRVLGDLAHGGYDAEWRSFRASQFGAAHIRDRMFILAYNREGNSPLPRDRHLLADPGSESRFIQPPSRRPCTTRPENGRAVVAWVWDEASATRRDAAIERPWEAEPHMGRVVHGTPDYVDRLRVLGNTVVPQIAEWIGRRLLKSYSCSV